MDTYYFSLSRYYDALDWYRDAYPPSTLGVAVANADVNPLSSPDEYLARARGPGTARSRTTSAGRSPPSTGSASSWCPSTTRGASTSGAGRRAATAARPW